MWRIKKVEMWTTLQASGDTVAITPLSTDTSLNFNSDRIREISDTSCSVDHPAHVVVNTKPSQPMGSWHVTSTVNASTQLFSFACPLEAIMDITFEGVINLSGAPNGYTRALVGATAGTLYATAIGASPAMTPVGINSI